MRVLKNDVAGNYLSRLHRRELPATDDIIQKEEKIVRDWLKSSRHLSADYLTVGEMVLGGFAQIDIIKIATIRAVF